jgi:ADP-L-glycero-D-manno-heptose 6-epimerase
MNKTDSIWISGAAGFIGSCLASRLLALGYQHLVLIDRFSFDSTAGKLKSANFQRWRQDERVQFVERRDLAGGLDELEVPQIIFHLGARTDTTEFNEEIFEELNTAPSQLLWHYASKNQLPLIYASSAATYGDGSLGYKDSAEVMAKLQPLNPYGWSKQRFDLWAYDQAAMGTRPSRWYGLKFFNVYGPNEFHKGRMASVVFHAFHQIQQSAQVKLFRSHRPDYADGAQQRDFVYVKDVLEMMIWLAENSAESGIYNIGSGQARSFLDLANSVFHAMDLEPNIEFIDMPEDIRERYQYHTEADMTKLRAAGFGAGISSLEEGIADYVHKHLLHRVY